MIRSLVVVAVYSLAISFAHAEIFKCVEGGKTVFSQQPCGNGSVTVKPRFVEVSPEAVEERKAATKQIQGSSSGIDREHRMMEIDRQLLDLDNEESQIQQARIAELKKLELTGRFANNNLAGATWQQSLAMEMQAVNGKYDSALGLISSRREALIRERDKLQAKVAP